jgi:signal transduction histidine kinase/CheY-like chemotaxis protein
MEQIDFLLSPGAMGFVPTFLVQVVILIVLLAWKQKSTATWLFIGWQAFLMLLVASLLFHAVIYAPVGGYLYWLGGIFLSWIAVILAIQFAYRFPRLLYPREAGVVLGITLAVCGVLLTLIVLEIQTALYSPVYSFESFYYDFIPTNKEPFLSSNQLFTLLHPLGFVWVLIIWLRQSVRLSHEATHHTPLPRFAWRSPAWWRKFAVLLWKPRCNEARAARALAMVFSIAVFAVILSILEDYKLIPIGSFASAFLVSEALFILTYLDYSPEATTFKIKLIGIPLVMTMMLAGLAGPLLLTWTQESYYEARRAEVQTIAHLVTAHGTTDEIPDGVRYVATRPASDGLFSPSYTVLYTRDPALDAAVLDRQDTHFRTLIEQGGHSNISALTWRHLTHIYPWLNQRFASVPTRSQLEKLIPPDGELSYRGYVDLPAYHFIRYTFHIDNHTLGEVGYSYAAYRQIIHARALPLLWLLLGTIVFFLIMEPFFVQSSLVKPLQTLLQGVRSVESDNLHVDVPIRASDEIGFLTGAFNRMVCTLRLSREELLQEIGVRQQKEQELTNLTTTLEERVEERTHDLQLAREEAEHSRDVAEHANQAKSIFLANMSHELRTPLNAILGFAQVMDRSSTLPHEYREHLAIISRSGEHLLTLINNVLDLSKIEAGRITLNERAFDLHRLLHDIEDMFCLRAKEKGLLFLVECAPDLPQYVQTDEVKLRQVLINLLSNAMKFTCEGSVMLRVGSRETVSREQGTASEACLVSNPHPLYFRVEDTGPGIAPDELDKLFEAFAQTSSGQQSREGTGLGLTISRKFVQLMGGDITVQSTVGQGSVFAFDVRVAVVQGEDTPTTVPKPEIVGLAPDQSTYRLLIADDQATNRLLLVKLLALPGFELREASNGEEAIAVWETWQPHLIWMDMRMPVLDGYETTRRIKATPRGQQTIVVALTASAFDEERAIVMVAGCDDFVRKPFRTGTIFETMGKHLGVRYLYANDEPFTVTRTSVALSSEALAMLPPDTLATLRHAAMLGDICLLDQAVETIRCHDEQLANVLQAMIDAFQFDQIVAAVEVVVPATGDPR